MIEVMLRPVIEGHDDMEWQAMGVKLTAERGRIDWMFVGEVRWKMPGKGSCRIVGWEYVLASEDGVYQAAERAEAHPPVEHRGGIMLTLAGAP